MKLSLEQIRSVTRGAVRVEETEGAVHFYRFTKAQEEMYRQRDAMLHMKTFATAGVILEFDTDSRNLGLSVLAVRGSMRTYCVHSILVNGQRIGQLVGERREDQETIFLEGRFALGEGSKRVKIVMPWTMGSAIRALELDEDATLTPVRKTRRILNFGDSITQGYDARYPENSYAARLTQWLDAENINKAIGGEVYCPELADLPEDFIPDLITVAYGTNDWSKTTKADFEANSRAFIQNLRKHYPDTKIIILAPVWRGDLHRETSVGNFDHVSRHLAGLARETENAVWIDCFSFIPHDPAYYQNDRLHPNDAGFACYAQRLTETLAALGIC